MIVSTPEVVAKSKRVRYKRSSIIGEITHIDSTQKNYFVSFGLLTTHYFAYPQPPRLVDSTKILYILPNLFLSVNLLNALKNKNFGPSKNSLSIYPKFSINKLDPKDF